MTHGGVIYAGAFAAACRPRRRLTVSEWADAHRVLSAKGSSEAGPWRTDRTPYLREIMDCLSDRSPIQRVVMMFCTQAGKTEVGLNWIGYIMDHAPGPMLTVVPTLEVRKRWVQQRLAPMLTESPALAALFDARRSRAASNAEDVKDYPGGMLVIGGANSPASLASMPIRYVLCDEVDRFPWEVGREGDPLGLIDERTKTFPRRKVLLCSTPTIKDASRIEDEFNASDMRRYHVPCPHCETLLVLKWGNLRWDKALTRAAYVCEHCGAEIVEAEKPRMLARGRWIAECPDRDIRGYHLSGLYAPIGLGFTWLELARMWAASHSDPAKLKRFVNTTLGEVWEDRSHDIRPQALMERAEDYPVRTVPPGCLLLTCGVDTQDDRLAVQILGWGRREACWVIDWVELPGNPALPHVWVKLTELLNTPLSNAHQRTLTIQATAIDTGGHHTHAVYKYVRDAHARRLMAIKGSNVPNKPIIAGRPQPQDINWRGRTIKRGVNLWMIGTDTAKHMLAGRLMADAGTEPGGRLLHFAKDLPPDYYDQITAEAFDPEKNRWVKRRGRRNEGIDTWVYATAAAQHPEIRVHAMRARDWQALADVLEPGHADSPPPATEDGSDAPPPKPKPKGRRRSRGRRWDVKPQR